MLGGVFHCLACLISLHKQGTTQGEAIQTMWSFWRAQKEYHTRRGFFRYTRCTKFAGRKWSMRMQTYLIIRMNRKESKTFSNFLELRWEESLLFQRWIDDGLPLRTNRVWGGQLGGTSGHEMESFRRLILSLLLLSPLLVDYYMNYTGWFF